jgi:hypothetical protein
MPKFLVYASEKVFYTKVVEVVDKETLKQMIEDGDIDFNNDDITDGEYFTIDGYFDEVQDLTNKQ